ncbi:MAG: hypothetical protein ACXVB6_15970, partial [Mucilaginibacter sp.]
MKKICLAFYILFSITSIVYAQQTTDKLIDVDFKQANISTVVSDLKLKTGYHFYYNPVQFDSLSVTLKANQKPLSEVLDKIFEN